MTRSDLLGRGGIRALIGYLAVWGITTAYIGASGGDWIFPFISLGILGFALSAACWLLTLKMDAPAVPVANPKRESLGLLAYLIVYAVLLIGIWLGTVRKAVPDERTQELAVLAYKLLIHVGIPAAI